MVMLHVVNITVILVGVPTAKESCTNLMNAMSSVLISRLILNLRDSDHRALHISSGIDKSGGSPTVGTISFRLVDTTTHDEA
ncbi:hypothetical protein OBBRIDRAFT_313461 [Obba rivulosa]|uniref:Secreted protein n=1 Tax=Obba rivulosa TaxID=1052685 RepID=A0A8E2ANW4_9APHY|nr:hypothetical protein OBBRIDRAFT_313461 [Obba rivulosa]